MALRMSSKLLDVPGVVQLRTERRALVAAAERNRRKLNWLHGATASGSCRSETEHGTTSERKPLGPRDLRSSRSRSGAVFSMLSDTSPVRSSRSSTNIGRREAGEQIWNPLHL